MILIPDIWQLIFEYEGSINNIFFKKKMYKWAINEEKRKITTKIITNYDTINLSYYRVLFNSHPYYYSYLISKNTFVKDIIDIYNNTKKNVYIIELLNKLLENSSILIAINDLSIH